MNQIKKNRVIQILYPLLVYFVIYQLGVSLLIDIIGDRYGRLMCLFIAGSICLIPIIGIYRAVPRLIPDKISSKRQLFEYLVWLVIVIFVAILTNIILTRTGLVKISAGFERASSTLTDGNLIIKLLCNCLVIPILEEVLMRGIIAGQLYMWYGTIPAVLISSIFFGILHNNIVQFIYAFIIGIALGLMYIKTRHLSLPIIAHCLANLVVIAFS